jgi:hypothetical protein
LTDKPKTLNLVEYVPWSEFTPAQDLSSTNTMKYTAKIAFDVSGKPGKQSTMLPSTSLEGSIYVTQHTALNDRHIVRGKCETYSWVNIDLIKDGLATYQSQQSVELDVHPQHLKIASSKAADGNVAATCQPVHSSLRSRWTSSPAAVTAEVSLPSDEEMHLMSSKNPNTDKTHTSVELPLHVAFSGLSDAVTDAISRSGGVKCDVETKWYSKRSFKTSSQPSTGHTDSDQAVITSQLVSSQASAITFPPLARPVDGSNHEESLSTIGMLHLNLPRSASLPTVQTNLLKVEYELELKYTLHLDTYKSPLLLKGKTKVECRLA